jgi:hypothetical protein
MNPTMRAAAKKLTAQSFILRTHVRGGFGDHHFDGAVGVQEGVGHESIMCERDETGISAPKE